MSKTVNNIIVSVCEDLCINYCKYSDSYNPDDHNGVELVDSGICDECPLNKLC